MFSPNRKVVASSNVCWGNLRLNKQCLLNKNFKSKPILLDIEAIGIRSLSVSKDYDRGCGNVPGVNA